MSDENSELETYKQLSAAQSAIHDSITLAKNGLNANPQPEERRALDAHILDLAEQNALLEGRILALLGGDANPPRMPTRQQIDEIAALSAEVEGLTNDNLTAALALSVATKGLKLATELANA